MHPTLDNIIHGILIVLFFISAFGVHFIFCMTRVQRILGRNKRKDKKDRNL